MGGRLCGARAGRSLALARPPAPDQSADPLARGTAADVRSALEILAALAEVAERSHNIRLLIEIMALRALALDAQGQAGDARDALLAAVDLARPGGFLRVFVALGLRTDATPSPLASQAANNGATAAPDHGLPALGGTFSTARVAGSPGLAGREPHQPRRVSPAGFSSPYLTAPRHTADIYGKLGVDPRQAAVARAKAMGLNTSPHHQPRSIIATFNRWCRQTAAVGVAGCACAC